LQWYQISELFERRTLCLSSSRLPWRALALPGGGRQVKVCSSALTCWPASGTPRDDGADGMRKDFLNHRSTFALPRPSSPHPGVRLPPSFVLGL